MVTATIIAITVILIIISIIYQKFNQRKNSKTKIEIYFIDYKHKSNYIQKLILQIPNYFYKIYDINKNMISIPIYKYPNTDIINGQISLFSSQEHKHSNISIKIYQNQTNKINIWVNNKEKTYYNLEIIYYSNNLPSFDNIQSDDFNYKKRIRYNLFNINKKKFEEIIKEEEKEKKKIIEQCSNKNMLINIIINNNNKYKFLYFIEEEKFVLIPSKNERKLITNFYFDILKLIKSQDMKKLNDNFNKLKEELFNQKEIFGYKINNQLKVNEKMDIYITFINQGINSLLLNNILENKKEDLYFILGYLFFLYMYQNKITVLSIKTYLEKIITLLNKMNGKCNEIDKIKILIASTFYYMNNKNRFDLILKYGKENLIMTDLIMKGLNFFENVILDLTEDSDLTLIYLQLNSGFSYELSNKKNCYKLSMLSIDDIKNHILKNNCDYFFIFESAIGDYASTDSRTQVEFYNTLLLIDEKENEETNIMNVAISKFHESGHMKFHSNEKIDALSSPILFINKNLEIKEQYGWNDKNKGESGKCVDNFLFGEEENISQKIIASSESWNLKNKNYFTGNLDELNKMSKVIISKYKEKIKNNPNEESNLNSLRIYDTYKNRQKKNISEFEAQLNKYGLTATTDIIVN